MVGEPYLPTYPDEEMSPQTKITGDTVICSSCGKLRLASIDITRGTETYRICKTCLKGSTKNKIRRCLKCDQEFLSFCDYRVCSRCKGRKWGDKISDRHKKVGRDGKNN